jgi:hypothetical protein
VGEDAPAEIEPLRYSWDGWNSPTYHERKKQSYAIMREAFSDKGLGGHKFRLTPHGSISHSKTAS